jgi:hypothetical protein
MQEGTCDAMRCKVTAGEQNCYGGSWELGGAGLRLELSQVARFGSWGRSPAEPDWRSRRLEHCNASNSDCLGLNPC